MLRLLKGNNIIYVRLVDCVVASEEGGAVVELRHQDWVRACDNVGGDAGQEEQVEAEDEEKAQTSKLHPFVSDQRQAERMPGKHKKALQ